jgi:hypothetical protein
MKDIKITNTLIHHPKSIKVSLRTSVSYESEPVHPNEMNILNESLRNTNVIYQQLPKQAHALRTTPSTPNAG